jgi:hypothetical protein
MISAWQALGKHLASTWSAHNQHMFLAQHMISPMLPAMVQHQHRGMPLLSAGSLLSSESFVRCLCIGVLALQTLAKPYESDQHYGLQRLFASHLQRKLVEKISGAWH